MHKTTGDIKFVSKSDGKKLDEDWARLKFTTNAEGKKVMRVNFGAFTMDVLENGTREVIETDGDQRTE